MAASEEKATNIFANFLPHELLLLKALTRQVELHHACFSSSTSKLHGAAFIAHIVVLLLDLYFQCSLT